MDEGIVDVVVTSPPYNIGTSYRSHNDKVARRDFLYWCGSWALEVHRVMAEDASFFLNVGAAPSNPLMPYQLLLKLTNPDAHKPLFTLQNTFHWVKSISVERPGGEMVSAGHFKPINSKRFVNDCHEFVFHLTKTGKVELDRRCGGVPYQDKSNIARFGHTGGRDLRCRGNTWFIPYKTIQSRNAQRPHPATFPVELPEQCLRLHQGLKPSERVMLDPFLGIGSSAVAAIRQDIGEFYGFELDEQYLEEAKKNTADAYETLIG